LCYFVTVGAREAGVSILDAEKRRREGLDVAPALNPHVVALFPPADKLFLITHGGCSCELYAARGARGSDKETIEKERARYRKKGWSEAKIRRALETKLAARAPVPRSQREDTPMEKLSDLLTRLAAVPGGVRIFVHAYSGSVDEEIVTGRRGKSLSVRSAIDGAIPEDVVVDLIAG
jgi:hypothetical protein